MPADQFNLRLRDDRAHAVRMQAARLGIKPRDVIEELIDAAPWSAIAGTPAQHEELPFPPSDPAQRDDDPAPPSGGESADQRAGDARTPRRRGRKDRADKGAEGAKSGQGRGGAPQKTDQADAPRSVGDDPAALSRACPACAGDVGPDGVCGECGFRMETEET